MRTVLVIGGLVELLLRLVFVLLLIAVIAPLLPLLILFGAEVETGPLAGLIQPVLWSKL